jgi:putative N6-adenine-specific DNA methylase
LNEGSKQQYVAKTFAGLEEVLARELLATGAEDIVKLQRAVAFSGGTTVLYSANYTCRTALKILRLIGEFTVASEDDLYQKMLKISWSNWLDTSRTFMVDTVATGPRNWHPGFLSLKAKDAIADYFRQYSGERPSVSKSDPDIIIHVFVGGDKCSVYLDSSGDPLFMRGYRLSGGVAPIKEVLAAGILALAGWDAATPLIDPMCGSGTLLTEAAYIALDIPAGYLRQKYAFMKWKGFDERLWDDVKDRYRPPAGKPKPIIHGYDISRMAIDVARKNISNAGLEGSIRLAHRDFFELGRQYERGMLIFNPPYDERIKSGDINDFYKKIGDTLKKNFAGYEAWILTANFDALKHLGLQTSRRIPLFNGPLECRLVRYDIFAGKRQNAQN